MCIAQHACTQVHVYIHMTSTLSKYTDSLCLHLPPLEVSLSHILARDNPDGRMLSERKGRIQAQQVLELTHGTIFVVLKVGRLWHTGEGGGGRASLHCTQFRESLRLNVISPTFSSPSLPVTPPTHTLLQDGRGLQRHQGHLKRGPHGLLQ